MSDTDFVDRLKGNVRKDIRYARGMQTMHRERYLEYCHDLREATQNGNLKRSREIADDLRAFVLAMWHLIEKQRAQYARLVYLTAPHDAASADAPDTALREEEPTTPIRLVKTSPQDG